MDSARARRLLGVEAGASDEAVEAAFRERVKEEHPDQSDRADSTERFKQLQTARETLLNAETSGQSSGTSGRSSETTHSTDGTSRQSGGRSRRTDTGEASTDRTSTRTEYTDTGGPGETASRREYTDSSTDRTSTRTEYASDASTDRHTRGRETTDPGSWDSTEYDVGGTETDDTDDALSLHDLRAMAPREFARAVADHWAGMGYDTAVRHASDERGIDVVAADPQSGERIVVQGTQAPAGTTYGESAVRQYGSLQSQAPYPDRVVAVTTGSFSGRAVAVAADIGVDLVDGQQLVRRLDGDRSGATGDGGSVLHRGVHEPAGSLTLGDSVVLGGSILSITAFASVAYLYGEFGVPVVISRTVRLAVVAGWLLTLGLLSGLLQRDDMDRPPHLEGKYLLASACGAFLGGATLASDSGLLGDALVFFGVFAVPLVGLASVARSYLSDGR